MKFSELDEISMKFAHATEAYYTYVEGARTELNGNIANSEDFNTKEKSVAITAADKALQSDTGSDHRQSKRLGRTHTTVH